MVQRKRHKIEEKPLEWQDLTLSQKADALVNFTFFCIAALVILGIILFVIVGLIYESVT